MTKQGVQGDVLGLFKFIKAGIEGREYSKFVFTKSLSEALELIAELGEEYNISREDMSFFDIYDLNEVYSSACDIKTTLLQSIEKGKKKYHETLNLSLPPVIAKAEDVYNFEIPNSVPNYITLKKVNGELIYEDLNNQTIENKILLIPAADPGFDWIFSCNIAGFITAFGGANSHMAIRAGELGIPAVIGVGEKVLENLKQKKFVNIDCANKKMEILS
jgi:phosphohistidine swiveling domain-containing protein